MTSKYQQMIDFLNTRRNMIICGHEQPDGDCLGSMLAVYHAFSGKQKNWRLVSPDIIPPHLSYLPGIELIIKPEDIDIDVDSVLILDCRSAHRTGLWLEPYLSGRPVYCADHHEGKRFDGNYLILEPDAAATAEIIAAIIDEAGIELNADIAINLYSGIVSDSGGFRYPCTTQRSLIQAAKLLPWVDIEQITVHIFEDCSLANMRLKGYCCSSMQLTCGGQLCYAVLDRPTIESMGAKPVDLSNIVNYTLMTHGVRLGVLFEEHDDFIKVSFRSRKGINVCDLAHSLGGGGHELAAGVRIREPLAIAQERVLNAAKEMIAQ